jgi:hypothetical protein
MCNGLQDNFPTPYLTSITLLQGLYVNILGLGHGI